MVENYTRAEAGHQRNQDAILRFSALIPRIFMCMGH